MEEFKMAVMTSQSHGVHHVLSALCALKHLLNKITE